MRPVPIQITRWLLQPVVWRIVGFASTVIGMFCYALSSSFKHLYGQWNLLKIFLYSVFSFIICLLILFAKVWQCSTHLLSKANMTFWVLTITSVYSFVYDKAVNGKPDIYSLISCGAFAIMSLSLSRQIRFGFEVDLLYFFLGCLIIQLMKIKWLLVIPGAGFSYSLINLRYTLEAAAESLYHGLSDHIVIQVDSQVHSTGNASPEANADIADFMQQLMACIDTLKKEDRNQIRVISNHVKRYLNTSEIGLLEIDPNLVIDALPSEIIKDLSETVKVMVASGLEEECWHVYKSYRMQFLEQCLSKFGLQEFNMEDLDNMESRLLKYRIESWTKASNIARRLLFPNERTLYYRVFSDFSSTAHPHLIELREELMIHILNFANSFAIVIRSPNPLCCNSIFDVLQTLHDVIVLFRKQSYLKGIASGEIADSKGLIMGIFMELGNRIRHDTRAMVFGGGVTPLTIYVKNCLRHLYKISDALLDGNSMASSLTIQIASIVDLLETNLKEKSKNYTNPAFGYVFKMNNWWHIGGELDALTLSPEDCKRLRTPKLWENLEHYQKSTWNKLLDLLMLDSNESVDFEESMIEKLTMFNMQFEEICRVQSTWFVIDWLLRVEIVSSLENLLLPAYGNFIGRFEKALGKDAYDYIQYGIFDFQTRLKHLLLGSNWMMNQLPKEKERLPKLV